jgi:hypothetical protein
MFVLRKPAITLAAAALASTLALGQPTLAQAATHPGWRIVFSHQYGGPANTAQYWAVSSAGPGAAWAVGGAGQTPDIPGWPVGAHWNGRGWFVAPMPHGLADPLTAVSADSGDDAWAVSESGGYLLHWTGGRWSLARRWPEHSLPTQVTGVTAFSPTNVWVFGGSGAFPGIGTWHLHGKTWTHVHGLGNNITSASALSPTDMWAIGGIEVGQDAIMRYIAGHWRHVVAKPLAGLQFDGIVAQRNGQVWALAVIPSTPFKSYILHLVEGRWHSLRVPWQVQPGQLASDGRDGVWLSAVSGDTVFAIHLTAAGRWTRTVVGSRGNSFFGLNLIAGTASLWGAGSMTPKTGLRAAVWAYGPVG